MAAVLSRRCCYSAAFAFLLTRAHSQWSSEICVPKAEHACTGNLKQLRLDISANPFNGIEADSDDDYGHGRYEGVRVPLAVDWDLDGDIDFVFSDSGGNSRPTRVRYFERQKDGTLVERIGDDNPFGVINIWLSRVTLAAADWDDDGDLDLLVGAFVGGYYYDYDDCKDSLGHHGRLFYYERVNRTSLEMRRGVDNPFRCIPVGRSPQPQAVDWDGDGDLDLAVATERKPPNDSDYFAELLYFEHVSSGALQEKEGMSLLNPFRQIPISTYDSDACEKGCAPRLNIVDWDGDGDFDVLIGDQFGRLLYYERVSSTDVEEAKLNFFLTWNPDAEYSWTGPYAVDWDGDRDMDVVLAVDYSRVIYLEQDTHSVFTQREEDANPFAELMSDLSWIPPPSYTPLHFYAGINFKANFVDWDGDNDYDLLLGVKFPPFYYYYYNLRNKWVHTVLYYEHVGGILRPSQWAGSDVFVSNAELAVGQEIPSYSVPFAFDWNNDSAMDLFVGDKHGTIHYFEQVADKLVERFGADNPFDELEVGPFPAPAIVDWDNDGDFDLLVGCGRPSNGDYYDNHLDYDNCYYYKIRYFEHVVSPSGSSFEQRRLDEEDYYLFYGPWDSPLQCIVTLQAVDVDGDGDYDLVVGDSDGRLMYFKRISNERLIQVDGEDNPFRDVEFARSTMPQLMDWDGDGDFDLGVAGMLLDTNYYYGAMQYFERQACDVEHSCSAIGVCDVASSTCSCPLGYGGDDACGLCEAGYERSEPDQCVPCADDQFSASAGDPCSACPAGKIPTESRKGCEECAAGTYAESGHASCSECGDGFAPETTAGPCVECEAGTFAASGHLCTSCPDGTVARAGSAACEACDDGYVPANGSGTCERCPAGRVASSGAATCTACDPGYFSPAGSSGCDPCGVGFRPADDSGSCEPCQEGTAAQPGDAFCASCSPGMYAMRASGSCESCDGGSVPDISRASCENCLPGFFAVSGDPECRQCPDGSFSQTASSECSGCKAGFVPAHHGGSCRPCEAGRAAPSNASLCSLCDRGKFAATASAICDYCVEGFVPTGDQATCEMCAVGTFAASTDAFCTPCDSGEVAVQGSGACSTCGEGFVPTDDKATCEMCAAGMFAASTDAVCTPCGAGEVAVQGSGACRTCDFGEVPDEDDCTPSTEVVVRSIFAAIVAFLQGYLLSLALRRTIHIEDITTSSVQVVDTMTANTVTILTCSRKHLLLGPLTVMITGTGQGSYFDNTLCRIEPVDPLRLTVTPVKTGARQIECSHGEFTLPFPRDLVSTGLGGIRVVYLLSLFPLVWAPAILMDRTASMLVVTTLVAVAGATCGALSGVLRRHVLARASTPIERRIRAFQRQHARSPTYAPPGAARAVMLQDIILFHAFFTEFIRERNAYYLVSNIVKPLTKKFRFSFAEVVGPVPITFFVSHFWGTGFREFVTCITHHAKEVKMLEATTPSVRPSGLGPPDFSYWVCFLSNNQWKLEEELGDWNESSFYKALSSDLCQATCMVTDTRAMPLTRTWCLFEVLLSFQKQEMGGLYTGLVYCTETGVMSFGNAGYDASVGLARRLSTLNVADATASYQQDKDMIDGLIIKQGGFDKMNFYLRSRAKEAMGTVSAKFSDDMHALESSLSVEQVSEELAFGDLPVEEVPEQVVSQEADSEGNDKAKALAVFNSVPTGGIESL